MTDEEQADAVLEGLSERQCQRCTPKYGKQWGTKLHLVGAEVRPDFARRANSIREVYECAICGIKEYGPIMDPTEAWKHD